MKASNEIIRNREAERVQLSELLSCRLSRIFHNAGIYTAGELMNVPIIVWIKIPGLTEADMKEIFEKVLFALF